MRRATILIICIALFLFSYCHISNAELTSDDLPNRDGIEVGPLIIHAAFKTEMQFDTNVFLENEDENFDVITILNPSVGLELPLRDNNISIDYDLRANIFGVHTDQSHIDHRIRGLAEINWTDYKISISNIYKYFSERAGSEDTGRVKRQNNFLKVGAEAEFEQLGFSAGYTFGVEDFISDDTIYTSTNGNLTYQDKNRFLNIIDAQASYRFLPKTSALLESHLGFLNYDSSESPDSWFTETLLGLKGDLREDFSTNIRVGVRYQEYDESDLIDTDDFIGPVVRGGATYFITDDDLLTLELERSVYESTFNNLNYYNVNFVGCDYTHFFNNKISARLFGHYQLNLYPSDATVDGVTKKRSDHSFGGGIGVTYDIRKWLSGQVSYEYRQRKSNFGTFDYVDNLITISGTVGF